MVRWQEPLHVLEERDGLVGNGINAAHEFRLVDCRLADDIRDLVFDVREPLVRLATP